MSRKLPIDRLQKVDLREVWVHEARDFTSWLADNLDVLEEPLGFKLSILQREAAAGSFSVDILAEDENGNTVVIENQLERTNHDHLGKLITYLSNFEASKVAVWITSNPRLEHEKAVHWLNESLRDATVFYLLKVEARRIGNSAPAPLFTVVAGPSVEGKQIGKAKVAIASAQQTRLDFWTQLLERAKDKLILHANISPSTGGWVSASGGRGFSFTYVVRLADAQVEFWIGRSEADENKRIFRSLFAKREAIEKVFGKTLEWQPLDNKQGCRIRYVISDWGLNDKEHWPELQDKLIDAMSRLHKAFQPEIKRL